VVERCILDEYEDQRQAESVRIHLPGIGSYRGRYAYAAVIASVILLLAALLALYDVEQGSQTYIRNITQRNSTAELLRDVRSHLDLVENRLQRIVIEPVQKDVQKLEQALTQLSLLLNHLKQLLAQDDSRESQAIANQLQADLDRLHRSGMELVGLRTEVERWFPAIRQMREVTYPHSQAALNQLDILLAEVDEELSAEQRLRVVMSVSTLRHFWSAMASELRLFVSNRFGVFASDASVGMRSRFTNVIYYAEEVKAQINTLKALHEEGLLGFLGAESIDEVESRFTGWMRGAYQISVMLEGSGWRRDVVMLQQTIDPLLEQMRQRLRVINSDSENQSAADITRLTNMARQLTLTMGAMALFTIILVLLAYIFLNRTLLKQIARTALALKQEAQGNLRIVPPPAKLSEMRDLVEAFNEMRRQVHMRQKHLDHMAYHDALTRLPNRVLFRDRLEHALQIAVRDGRRIGLMFMDLDRFKQVNDSLGHLVGDELLKVVAERLQRVIRGSDTAARLSGDEFAVLAEGINDRADMIPLADKVVQALEQPVCIDEHELRISVSIGIAIAPEDDHLADDLIRDADTAMYAAKKQRGSAYRYFAQEMISEAAESLQLENELRQAVEAGQFLFHYQPVVSLWSGELYCCEALLRWRHPTKGLLSPAVFLDTLDDTGLIVRVIDSLLDSLVDQQKFLSRLVGRPVALALNLSPRLLNDPPFCRGLLKRLLEGQFQTGSLILELTEDTLTHELAEANELLQQLKNLGARVALDDFGVGQASLNHLRQFPFDLVKIDRDFIRNVISDSNDASLVQAIIHLAHAFDMKVVAEGVETKGQLAFVQNLGCDFIQGYLIGMPLSAEQAQECAAVDQASGGLFEPTEFLVD